MNWEQQQQLARQRRIREFQAQHSTSQNASSGQGDQYVYQGPSQTGYSYPYQGAQQSYVYPPAVQWNVVNESPPPRSNHPQVYPAGYGHQYYSQYYQQQARQVQPPPPTTSTNYPPLHPWQSAPSNRTTLLAKPSGKGLTYAELLSKALPQTPTLAPKASHHVQHLPSRQSPAPRPPPSPVPASPALKPVAPTPSAPSLPLPPKQPVQQSDLPPSLLRYVERAFEECRNEQEKSEIQKLLRLRINRATESGVLWTQDWDGMALPKFAKSVPADSTSSEQLAAFTGKRKTEAKLSKKQLKKLKKQQALVNAANTVLSNQSTPKKNVSSMFGAIQPLQDSAIQLRNARFGKLQVEEPSSMTRPLSFSFKKPELPDSDIELDWESLKICGTSTQLEKKYLRLTSAPDPSTVRPLSVLKRAFKHIVDKWGSDRQYLFFWEQMKSLRQDLTIQHIMDSFTVEVYETNARICLDVDDLSEYNQCQTQLSELYDSPTIEASSALNVDEFLAYRLLYLLLTNDSMSISLMLLDTSSEERVRPSLFHAIATMRAFRTHDFNRFFELARKSPLRSWQIVRHLYPSVRHEALLRIAAAHRPTITVSAVAAMLGFDDASNCRAWLRASGAIIDTDRDCVLAKESTVVRAGPDDVAQETVGVTHGTF